MIVGKIVGEFPFSGDGRPFFDHQPYLGGEIRVLNNIAANTDTTISHNLRVIARGVIIIDPGTGYLPSFKRGAAAWTTSGITLNFQTAIAAGQNLKILIF